jgi:hypothetical protein
MTDLAAAKRAADERVLNGLLLAILFVAGVVMVREGPHYDNVFDGWPFFTSAFFVGALAGFLGWTYSFGARPALKFSGAYRQPWLAALILGLIASSTASYVNRTFATPTERVLVGEIDALMEGKGNRWYVGVKNADGRYQRYLISKESAEALKSGKTVRLHVARGALGFEFVSHVEPARS